MSDPSSPKMHIDVVCVRQGAPALLHENMRKFGTVCNTVSPGTDLAGTLRRKHMLPT